MELNNYRFTKILKRLQYVSILTTFFFKCQYAHIVLQPHSSQPLSPFSDVAHILFLLIVLSIVPTMTSFEFPASELFREKQLLPYWAQK